MVGLCRPLRGSFPAGIAEIEAAEGLDVAAEIQAAGVLAGSALGVSVEMDHDVNGLWFGAQVVPDDDEVGPSLSAVCGEERDAIHFQMRAFPGALAGGLAGGVSRDFALRYPRERFGVGWWLRRSGSGMRRIVRGRGRRRAPAGAASARPSSAGGCRLPSGGAAETTHRGAPGRSGDPRHRSRACPTDF